MGRKAVREYLSGPRPRNHHASGFAARSARLQVRSLPIRLQPTATRASVRPCSWTFTSVAIFGSHNRSQSFSDFFQTTRPAPPTWRRLAGAAGSGGGRAVPLRGDPQVAEEYL